MFPDVINKKFTEISTGTVVSVTEQFEDVAILNNNSRINLKRLLDGNFYSESLGRPAVKSTEDYVDPKDFFDNSSYKLFADKIKSIPNEVINNLKDERESDSAIMEVDPEMEKRELQNKANQMMKNLNPSAAAQKQTASLMSMIGEDVPEEQVIHSDFNNTKSTVEGPVVRINADREETKSQQTVTQPISRPVENVIDPIFSIFKGVKRNKDFSFVIEISDKIPRVDFIEMMEDSYEKSIIDFLADEFTEKIISDPELIRSKIKKEIHSIVYGEKKEDVVDTPKSKEKRSYTRKKV
jgi:hypothetical protein